MFKRTALFGGVALVMMTSMALATGDGGAGEGGGEGGGEGDGGGLSPGAAAAIGGQGPDGGGTVGRDPRLTIPLGQGGGSRPSRGFLDKLGPF